MKFYVTLYNTIDYLRLRVAVTNSAGHYQTIHTPCTVLQYMYVLWSVISFAGHTVIIARRSLIHGLRGGCLQQEQVTGVEELAGIPQREHLWIT